MMPLSVFALLAWSVVAGEPAGDDRVMRGVVVDEAGAPVAGAEVASFWSANGTRRRPDGSAYDLSKREEVERFWGDVGRMEPSGDAATTAEDGTFSYVLGSIGHHVLVLDRDRRRGGLGLLPPRGRPDEPVTITLRPLTRVRGRMATLAGDRPDWVHLYTEAPADPTRPIDSTRLVSCGSFSGTFAMLLPPGSYTFDAYGVTDSVADVIDVRVEDVPTLTLTGAEAEADLGTLTLVRTPTLEERLAGLAAEGVSGDAAAHVGRRPPPIESVAGRGVPAGTQPWDFPGKWVLLDFWGFDCRPCLGRHLPALIDFYETHADRRDRFEILSVCIDVDGQVDSIDAFEDRLRPLVQHVWGGRDLPFPVLLDPSLTTYARYGLNGYPTTLLIDPDGRLVEGGLDELAERLAEPPASGGSPDRTGPAER